MASRAKPTPTPPLAKTDNRRGQTLRLSLEAWKALKIMAIDEGVTVHKILIDGVNSEFRKRGKPEIA